MKVVFDHQIFCSQVYGGISRYFCEIGSHLSGLDEIELSVVCPISINKHLYEAKGLRLVGKHIRKLPRSVLAMRMLNNAIAPAYIHSRRKTNIYHETYYSCLDLAPRGASVVITIHDMIHEKFPHLFSASDLTRHKKLAALERAQRIICVSESTKNDLLSIHDIDESIISVIPHGVDYEVFGKRTSTAPRLRQLLYVGARNGYKNFEALLHSFSRSLLPSEGFQLVCFGGGVFTKREEFLISEFGVSGKVKYRAGNDSALAGLFLQSSAFVYPSLYEGFGIPILEAMASGCPVICSNSSSLPEVAGNAAELFDPRSQESIQSSMEAVALSASRSAELSSLGLAQVRRFSWAQSAALTLNAYRSAI